MVGIIAAKIAKMRERRDGEEGFDEFWSRYPREERDWDRLLAVAARWVKWEALRNDGRHQDAVYFVGPVSEMGLLSKEHRAEKNLGGV